MYRDQVHLLMQTLLCYVLVVASGLISACQKQTKPTADRGLGRAGLDLTAIASPKGMVHRKRADVLQNILFKALDLPDKKAVCTELGKKKLQCADVVHRVALGRMEAYNNSQYHHPEGVSLISPIAFDRLILTACSQRALQDAATMRDNVLSDRAVIFKGVKLTSDGRLVRTEAIDQAVARLYQRGLSRDPTELEKKTVVDLYEQIFQESRNNAAINWMKLSCYMVFSTIEGAFY